MAPQWVLQSERQDRDPILRALASANGDLVAFEVDILDPKPAALEDAKAAAVYQRGHEPGRSTQPPEDGVHLPPRQDQRNSNRALGAWRVLESLELALENGAKEEQERAERLVLGRRRDLAVQREPCQESLRLAGVRVGRIEVARQAAEEPPHPADVGSLGSVAVVTEAQRLTQPFEEASPCRPELGLVADTRRSR
jgi:hypothetical protein